MTALPPSSAFTGAATQSLAETAYANQRTFLAGLLGTTGLVADALNALGTLAGSFATKTAAYTVVLADRGKLIHASSGTWTLSLPASATAGAGFSFIIRNGGAGVITIDGNGSETINFALTKVLNTQSACILVATGGTGWLALDLPGPGQLSATDATIGSVLQLATNGGSFGLGNTGNLADVVNLDDQTLPTGYYSMRSGGSGTRPSGVAGTASGVVHVQFYGAGLAQQQLRLNNPAAGFAGVYTRQYFSGAWTTWDNGVMRSELLGTVSQTGGVPTGKVIERGSNANGEYVKFADGTLMCTSSGLSAANASTALGNIFRSADVAWTFPAAFVSTTHLIVKGDVDDADCWLSANTLTTTGCNVRALAGVTKASALTCRASAIGRWF
jgi:hypothetical protein